MRYIAAGEGGYKSNNVAKSRGNVFGGNAKMEMRAWQNIRIPFLESEGLSELIYLIFHESATHTHKQSHCEFGSCETAALCNDRSAYALNCSNTLR